MLCRKGSILYGSCEVVSCLLVCFMRDNCLSYLIIAGESAVFPIVLRMAQGMGMGTAQGRSYVWEKSASLVVRLPGLLHAESTIGS
jgi:hypothetical protein